MTDKKWVLITGASTGIGRACAELLASSGFGVYACARKKGDLADLARIPGIEPVALDVTSAKDVKAAAALVARRKTGLYGLVNNAGIAVAGPLIDVTDEDLLRQFDVNLFGVHRVTRAFLPLLMESAGRIVMISSDSGFFATPFFGPYCSSKFALEGYADSLRREMLLCGVKVVIIQPGRVATPIWDKGEKMLQGGGTEPFAGIARRLGEHAIKKGKSTGLQPVLIARLVQEALTKVKPRLRYLIAPSTLKYRIIKLLPAGRVDEMVRKELEK
ncbi:MAG TPA: SDR family oxidoreductase [Spirochaetota bacterium]|nr:SDR family oxidoreductase [Spirochaetota bacterium]HOD16368.1 SDR family oxidoreductase [Spirochaetota bacterium]HPN10961.1 SDR family oxidoreductase [Spirochaetota bacterium]HQL82557.1 SDR family oxidoreductase [Spirochaetota bacterium]